ncbi:hypothetical protein V6N13_124972 [Hibiscus sabdariffa]
MKSRWSWLMKEKNGYSMELVGDDERGGLSDGRRSNGESSLGDSLVLVQWRWGKVDGVEVDEWVILMDGELPSSLTCAPGGSIRVLIDLLSDH